jgi:hypothetical protein
LKIIGSIALQEGVQRLRTTRYYRNAIIAIIYCALHLTIAFI